MMQPFTAIEVEIVAQPGLQLTHCVILVEKDAFVLDAAPWTFVEDVVEGAAPARRRMH